MFSFLKKHPFAVQAFFESSTVLTFALPKEKIASMIPECLELDTFEGRYAFIAVALVKTKKLRPKGFPEFIGSDFFLIGYRIFVKYITNTNRRLRGLYILKSETDKRRMQFLGSIFTSYNYSLANITQKYQEDRAEIRSDLSGFRIITSDSGENIPLPETSPFKDWKEARKFAGPMPFTFTYDPQKRQVLLIEGVRQNWTPEPIRILEYNIPFLKEKGFEEAILANSFIIRNVPYYWKKGKVEFWKP
ncbi:DUF2071 domain-containing protein [Leptospira koniambonensis]|uniref:DUF2071 domain-containing protein n=1 Tax=Leptospira koniambonensis TaxID=2484950 RepID=UPI003EB6CF48